MTDRRRERRPPGPLVSLVVDATPLAWTALICAAMYYGLGVRPAPQVFESTQDSTRCVLVSPPGAADIRAWERNLYDWAALRDPSLLVLPNERFGYSRERFAKLEVPCAPVPAYRFTMTPIGQSPPPPLALTGPAKTLGERLAVTGEPIRPPPVKPFEVRPLERGVFWHTPDGRLLAGLPALNEREARAALARGSPPRAPTGLRITRPADRDAVARIQLTGSSGNDALDSLALIALRRAAGEQQKLERSGGPGVALAEFFPTPGSSVELQVEWSLAENTEPVGR